MIYVTPAAIKAYIDLSITRTIVVKHPDTNFYLKKNCDRDETRNPVLSATFIRKQSFYSLIQSVGVMPFTSEINLLNILFLFYFVFFKQKKISIGRRWKNDEQYL